MNVAEYIVNELIKYGVTETFGIPGGVVLKLLYAMQSRVPEITPHLSYHEQMAGFAACGYAQAGGRLGVAYATRGPGIANMATCIAEAWQESLPVLFITAHSSANGAEMRFEDSQEMDLTESIARFTKYSTRVEAAEGVPYALHKACMEALSGRKGPAFLDVSSRILGEGMPSVSKGYLPGGHVRSGQAECEEAIRVIRQEVGASERPVILVGDGVRQISDRQTAEGLFQSIGLPILSSRAAQDVLNQLSLYFGYIGSHGTRYGNFILSKADLVIAVGNRLAFPMDSESFSPVVSRAKVIRLEIDDREFHREIPNSQNFCVDVREFAECFERAQVAFGAKLPWVSACNTIRDRLGDYDITEPVEKLIRYLKKEKKAGTYVCDVGNNEFWFARAFERVRMEGTLLYSKSFGTLGAALGRAIGAYHATGKPVVCVMGDQGFQYNIQELQYIAYWKIPIKTVLLNNACSGMILDHEKSLAGNELVHVTEGTGYSTPGFRKIVEAYGINYIDEPGMEDGGLPEAPFVYEIRCGEERLTPYLPRGNACQDMAPAIDSGLYDYLDKL